MSKKEKTKKMTSIIFIMMSNSYILKSNIRKVLTDIRKAENLTSKKKSKRESAKKPHTSKNAKATHSLFTRKNIEDEN